MFIPLWICCIPWAHFSYLEHIFHTLCCLSYLVHLFHTLVSLVCFHTFDIISYLSVYFHTFNECILRKTQFLRYYSVRWVNTERLVERETLLHRFGSKLNRIVFNSCGNPIIRSGNNT